MGNIDPEMEIEGTSDMTGSGGIHGIDDEELKRVFFDLMNFDSKRFPKKKRVVFKVPSNMHNSMLKLLESGVFVADKVEMYRGLLGLGLMVMDNQRGLCMHKVDAIILASKGSRVKSNIKKLNEILGYLDRNENTVKMLEGNIKKHGNNAYGVIINIFLGKSEIVEGEDCKIVVPPHIEKRCMDAIEEIEGNNKFYIPKVHGVESPKIDIKIPIPLTFFAYILKDSYDKPKMVGEIYRAAFINGLEKICNWVIQGEIPEDEYNFCKILHNIYDYLTDNCA